MNFISFPWEKLALFFPLEIFVLLWKKRFGDRDFTFLEVFSFSFSLFCLWFSVWLPRKHSSTKLKAWNFITLSFLCIFSLFLCYQKSQFIQAQNFNSQTFVSCYLKPRNQKFSQNISNHLGFKIYKSKPRFNIFREISFFSW